MPNKRNSGLDKVLGRVDDLDSVNLAILVERLARERRLQETIFNTIKDGVLVTDAAGTVEYANDAARDLIGIKETEVGSTRLWKMVPELARSVEKPAGGGAGRRSGGAAISREVEMTYPEHRIVRLYMVPIEVPATGGESDEGFVVVLTDITEERVTLEQRIESERIDSIVRLAAGVAHELGNPLNSLTIHLQLIERLVARLEPRERDRIADSLAVCRGEVERLDGIIAHFLEAVRPRDPELNELDLLDLLEEVLRVLMAEIKDRSIDVEVEINRDLPVVLGDRGQVKQVFFNIVKNAVEAMQPGGNLQVRANADDEFVFLRFADDGSGISEERLSKVFDAYYTTKEGGHGLGMMIVQRIMRNHGGQIGIDSREGVGTVVTLQFPLPHRRVRMLEGK